MMIWMLVMAVVMMMMMILIRVGVLWWSTNLFRIWWKFVKLIAFLCQSTVPTVAEQSFQRTGTFVSVLYLCLYILVHCTYVCIFSPCRDFGKNLYNWLLVRPGASPKSLHHHHHHHHHCKSLPVSFINLPEADCSIFTRLVGCHVLSPLILSPWNLQWRSDIWATIYFGNLYVDNLLAHVNND